MFIQANLHTHILINYANKETEIPFYSIYKKWSYKFYHIKTCSKAIILQLKTNKIMYVKFMESIFVSNK